MIRRFVIGASIIALTIPANADGITRGGGGGV